MKLIAIWRFSFSCYPLLKEQESLCGAITLRRFAGINRSWTAFGQLRQSRLRFAFVHEDVC